MKLCKDCINFIRRGSSPEYEPSSSICGATHFKSRIEPVMGTVVPAEFVRCSVARQEGWSCGPQGTKWRPRDSDGSGEAAKTQSGLAVDDSAGLQGIAPTPSGVPQP